MTQEEWDKQQSEKDDDERLSFRVLSMIMEAKRPNATSFETLLTREALYAQEEMEEYLYSLKLPADYLRLTPPIDLKNLPEDFNKTMVGLGDLCE